MIIARYLSRKILFTTLAVTLILLMVVISGRLARYIGAAADGQLAVSLVIPVVFFRMPQLLELILPASLLLGIMLSLGELYETNEMTVMSATGISDKRVLGISLGAALFVAAVVMLFSFYVSPKGNQFVSNLVNAQGLKSELSGVAPETFYELQDQGGTVYAGHVDTERRGMESVFLFRPEPIRTEEFQRSDQDKPRQTIVFAERGYQEYRDQGGFYFVLENGIQFEGNPGDQDYILTRFEKYSQRLELPEQSESTMIEEQESMVISDLAARRDLKSRAEFHWRLSLPLVAIMMACIAVPLSRSSPRQGRYYLLLPAFLLYLLYLVALNAGKEAVGNGESGPATAIWLVHALVAGLAILLALWPRFRLILRRRS